MKNQSSHHLNRYKLRSKRSVLAGFNDPHFPPFKVHPDTSDEDIGSDSGERDTPPPSAKPPGQVGRKGLSRANIVNTMPTGMSTRRRKHSPTSDLHGASGSFNDPDNQQKRRRLNISNEEAKVLLDENGIAILEKALLRIAEEAREDRQEISGVLKEIGKKLDNLAPSTEAL